MRAEQLWREYTGGVAWPTLGLAAVVLLGELMVWTGVLTQTLPLWAGSLVCVVLVYLAFTPLHEAVHGNLGRRWLDRVVGPAMALFFTAPYAAFSALHLRHHAATNDPERDPDFFVAGSHPVGVALRCLAILPHYYAEFLRPLAQQSPGMRRARPRVLAGVVGVVTVTVGAIVAGLGWQLLWLWWVPAWVASGVLALVFDWLPHHPHARQGRFVDTRAIEGRWLDLVLLYQNLHVIHHLWPKVPFYAYGEVLERTRAHLLAQGTELIETAPGRAQRVD